MLARFLPLFFCRRGGGYPAKPGATRTFPRRGRRAACFERGSAGLRLISEGQEWSHPISVRPLAEFRGADLQTRFFSSRLPAEARRYPPPTPSPTPRPTPSQKKRTFPGPGTIPNPARMAQTQQGLPIPPLTSNNLKKRPYRNRPLHLRLGTPLRLLSPHASGISAAKFDPLSPLKPRKLSPPMYLFYLFFPFLHVEKIKTRKNRRR